MEKMEKWVHPYASLDEITDYAAAYLELLVLASGLQSSGQPFAWTADNLQKALGWASHLEQAMAGLSTTEAGMESRRALDAALTNLTASAQTFPAGLTPITAHDLSSARRLLLQTLLQAVSPNSDYFESITEGLTRLDENDGDVGDYIIEAISARNSALRSADSLKNFVGSAVGCLVFEKKQIPCVTSIWQTSLTRDNSNADVEMADENHFEAWARNAMEYVASFTTVYKTSAANLIFKSREEDWRRALGTARAYTLSTMISDGVGNDSGIAELCCLQLAFSECRDLAFRIAESPLNTICETATNLCPAGKEHGEQIVSRCRPEEAVSIETFLVEILEKHGDLWWNLPPVLLAGVCASRFSILKTYLQTMTRAAQVNGCFCKCLCHIQRKTCHSCKQCSNALMERLWCFGVYHPKLRTFEAQQVNSVCSYLLDRAQKQSV